MSDPAVRQRWRDLERQLKALPLAALAPDVSSARDPAHEAVLENAIFYALGLQGDFAEAKALAAKIDIVHEAKSAEVYVVTTYELSEEEVENLTQGLREAAGVEMAHVIRPDAADWLRVRPK